MVHRCKTLLQAIGNRTLPSSSIKRLVISVPTLTENRDESISFCGILIIVVEDRGVFDVATNNSFWLRKIPIHFFFCPFYFFLLSPVVSNANDVDRDSDVCSLGLIHDAWKQATQIQSVTLALTGESTLRKSTGNPTGNPTGNTISSEIGGRSYNQKPRTGNMFSLISGLLS